MLHGQIKIAMFNLNKFILDVRLMEHWCMYNVSWLARSIEVRLGKQVWCFFFLLFGSFSFADGRMSSFQ